jgi:5-methylcytosine-specific restriction endonuclease McrA
MKICNKCNKQKESTEFYEHSGYRDGLDGTCKACQIKRVLDTRKKHRYKFLKYSRAYYRKNRTKLIAAAMAYTKAHQVQRRLRENAWYKANLARCREQHRLASREWRKKNPDGAKACTARYRWKHHKYLQQTRWMRDCWPTGLTAAEWKMLKQQYGYRCAYCGKRKALTIDHIVPLCRGGTHEVSNILPACFLCNCSKQGYLLGPWLKSKNYTLRVPQGVQ